MAFDFMKLLKNCHQSIAEFFSICNSIIHIPEPVRKSSLPFDKPQEHLGVKQYFIEPLTTIVLCKSC